jgi:hypothetical protein
MVELVVVDPGSGNLAASTGASGRAWGPSRPRMICRDDAEATSEATTLSVAPVTCIDAG